MGSLGMPKAPPAPPCTSIRPRKMVTLLLAAPSACHCGCPLGAPEPPVCMVALRAQERLDLLSLRAMENASAKSKAGCQIDHMMKVLTALKEGVVSTQARACSAGVPPQLASQGGHWRGGKAGGGGGGARKWRQARGKEQVGEDGRPQRAMMGSALIPLVRSLSASRRLHAHATPWHMACSP